MNTTPDDNNNLLEFKKIIIDMTHDLLNTFPELRKTLNADLAAIISKEEVASAPAVSAPAVSAPPASPAPAVSASLITVYEFCKKVYPDKFFDILYQNDKIFANPLEFLPGIDFALLWKENITAMTRETIWKYLQLVLFTVVANVSDGASFGDTAKLFEAINADEFKSKIEETIKNMHDMFGAGTGEAGTGEAGAGEAGTGANTSASASASAGGPNINVNDLPDAKDIHEHLSSMMNGKIGRLAKEIAEETAAELNMDSENACSMEDIFKNLMKNPTKLMGLVKNVGAKLDQKMKSGDMKESELLQEASELLQKMKNMPGMGSMQSMFEKMGLGKMPGASAGGGGKVNINAMQSKLDKNLKSAKNRERMLYNLMQKQQQQAAATATASATAATASATAAKAPAYDDATLISTFSKGEKVERSTPADKPSKNKKRQNKK